MGDRVGHQCHNGGGGSALRQQAPLRERGTLRTMPKPRFLPSPRALTKYGRTGWCVGANLPAGGLLRAFLGMAHFGPPQTLSALRSGPHTHRVPQAPHLSASPMSQDRDGALNSAELTEAVAAWMTEPRRPRRTAARRKTGRTLPPGRGSTRPACGAPRLGPLRRRRQGRHRSKPAGASP